MFNYLVNRVIWFVAATFAVTALNAAMSIALARSISRQNFVAQENWNPPRALRFAKSQQAKALLPFFGATFSSLSAILLPQPLFVQFFLGGFFLLQLYVFAALCANTLRYRYLANAAAARGRIEYSGWFANRNVAAQFLGGAILALLGFGLTRSPTFAGAAFCALGTAAGAEAPLRWATHS